MQSLSDKSREHIISIGGWIQFVIYLSTHTCRHTQICACFRGKLCMQVEVWGQHKMSTSIVLHLTLNILLKSFFEYVNHVCRVFSLLLLHNFSPTLPGSLQLVSLSTSCCLLKFILLRTSWVQLVLTILLMCVGPSTGAQTAYQWVTTSKKSDFPSFSRCQLLRSPLLVVEP